MKKNINISVFDHIPEEDFGKSDKSFFKDSSKTPLKIIEES